MCMIVDLILIYLFVFNLSVWVKVYIFFLTRPSQKIYSHVVFVINSGCAYLIFTMRASFSISCSAQIYVSYYIDIDRRYESAVGSRLNYLARRWLSTFQLLLPTLIMFDISDKFNEVTGALLYYFCSKMSDQILMPELQRKLRLSWIFTSPPLKKVGMTQNKAHQCN